MHVCVQFVCVCVVCGHVYGNGGTVDGAESVAVVLSGFCVLTRCMRWRQKQAAAATQILVLVGPNKQIYRATTTFRGVYDSVVSEIPQLLSRVYYSGV